MLKYKSVKKYGIAEIIIEKSRFISQVQPVENKEEAMEFFAKIKNDHKTATHNVPAYVLGEKSHLMWTSDDGEPQGTSGPPILQMLLKEELTNLALMVTRYYGGVKLGTGGLVRAYTAAAKAAIEQAGICQVQEMQIVTLKMDYNHLGKIQNLENEGMFSIRNIIYEDKITVEIIVEPANCDEIIENIANITAGNYEEINRKEELIRI